MSSVTNRLMGLYQMQPRVSLAWPKTQSSTQFLSLPRLFLIYLALFTVWTSRFEKVLTKFRTNSGQSWTFH